MKLPEFLLFLTVLLALAIWTVREESRTVRLGYRLSDLAEEQEQLEVERQELLYRHALLAAPDRLEQLAREYELDLVPPGGERPNNDRPDGDVTRRPRDRQLTSSGGGD